MRYEEKLVGAVLRKENGYTDHVGIELEIEGKNLPLVDTRTWRSDKDGSLRGESFEYVLKEPVPRDGIHKALCEIDAKWKGANAIIKNSPNAGTHVHINVSDLTVTELFNFLTLYFIVETPLVDQCGEDRVGNLFCLRSCDAEYLMTALEEAVRKSDLRLLHTDDLRYASVNVKALGDYGSVEFRAWRSDGDIAGVERWANILLHLKDKARQIDSPAQIVADVSMMGSYVFYQGILGEFVRNMEWKPEYEEIIRQGVRLTQQYAFAGDW